MTIFSLRMDTVPALAPGGFADVFRLGAGHRDNAGVSGFAVPGGDGGRLFDHGGRRFFAGRALQDNMTSWNAADMKPEVVRPGGLETQNVIVGIAAAGQGPPVALQSVFQQSGRAAASFLFMCSSLSPPPENFVAQQNAVKASGPYFLSGRRPQADVFSQFFFAEEERYR